MDFSFLFASFFVRILCGFFGISVGFRLDFFRFCCGFGFFGSFLVRDADEMCCLNRNLLSRRNSRSEADMLVADIE